MLTNLENKLEELFQTIEQMPPEKVEEAERAKEKERRLKQREDRIIEQKRYQEERIRKALERARAEPKKYVMSTLTCIHNSIKKVVWIEHYFRKIIFLIS